MKFALVCGAGGFIGNYIVKQLKREKFWVRAVDIKHHEFDSSAADEFIIADLRDPQACRAIVDRRFDETYQLAADMGGARYLFTGENDAAVMHNSASIMRFARCNLTGPFNIGSEETVTINQLAAMAMDIAGKRLRIKHVPGPMGVRGRSSANHLIRQSLNWAPSKPLRVGLEKTYAWIEAQVRQARVPQITAA